MPIPKIIHQTVASKLTMPDAFRQNADAIRKLNPGWEYRLYDDDDVRNFIASHFDRATLGYYERINPSYGAAKADLFRYLAVYADGGVYLDIKSTVTKPLDEVIRADDTCLLSFWPNKRGEPFEGWGFHAELNAPNGEYLNWYVAAAPKHPLLAAVIAQVKENIDAYTPERYGVGKTGVLRTTGPIAYTRGLLKNQSGANYRIADIRDLGFQYSIFGTDQNTKFDHIKMFRNHYAFCTEPVVLGNFVNARGEVNASWGKIGRNEPCPCGSGKRFKHCHGAIR